MRQLFLIDLTHKYGERRRLNAFLYNNHLQHARSDRYMCIWQDCSILYLCSLIATEVSFYNKIQHIIRIILKEIVIKQ